MKEVDVYGHNVYDTYPVMSGTDDSHYPDDPVATYFVRVEEPMLHYICG